MKKFKRNNPLNIRYSVANAWEGQIGEENGFCVFRSSDYGFRAAFYLLKNYGRAGYINVESIIHRWSPPSENPTEQYVKFVCDKMQQLGYESYGVEFKDSHLDMTNSMIIADLIYCMTLFESGIKVQHKEIISALTRIGAIKQLEPKF